MQVDLFAGDPAAPPAGAIEAAPAPRWRLPLPVRIPAWEALLKRSPAADNIILQCCPLWTGVVLEVLSCPDLGRKWLDRNGAIVDIPADSAHGRTVYVTADQLRAWHMKRELIHVPAAGTQSVRYRFGDAPATKPLVFPYPFTEKALA